MWIIQILKENIFLEHLVTKHAHNIESQLFFFFESQLLLMLFSKFTYNHLFLFENYYK